MKTNSLQRLCTSHEMQAMDNRAIHQIGIPGMVLMENAARSVVDLLEKDYLNSTPQARLLVCCGKGNNGGDGYAIARLLKNRGYRVQLMEKGTAKGPDAQLNRQIWSHFGKSLEYSEETSLSIIQDADIIIDALFGTGMERKLEGDYFEWIQAINESKATKIGVDVPSGIHADSGQVMGIAVQCEQTVSFQVGKQGCFQYPGVDYCGELHVVPISIEPYWDRDCLPTYLLTTAFMQEQLQAPRQDAHKGNLGHLMTICGSAGMGGAALLCSQAALKNGCGLVTACVPASLQNAFLSQCPEVMTLSPHQGDHTHFTAAHLELVCQSTKTRDAVVLGCGVGPSPETKKFVQSLVSEVGKPTVIDADGLNAISKEHLQSRTGETIITPHPKELSRLSGISVETIQSDRIGITRKLAQEWQVVLLLKGAHTVVGAPDGQIFINPTGNEGMATAGSGDVLSGIIGSFLSQGYSPLLSTLLGVFLHGLSGDCLRELLEPSYMSAINLIHGLNEARISLENS